MLGPALALGLDRRITSWIQPNCDTHYSVEMGLERTTDLIASRVSPMAAIVFQSSWFRAATNVRNPPEVVIEQTEPDDCLVAHLPHTPKTKKRGAFAPRFFECLG